MKKRGLPHNGLPSIEPGTATNLDETQTSTVSVMDSDQDTNLDESPLEFSDPGSEIVTLDVPFGRPPSANESARIGNLLLRNLTTHQKFSLLCLKDGLSRSGAKLKNGTPVDRPSHVLKYLLEQAIDKVKSQDS